MEAATFKINQDILNTWKNELESILISLPELQKTRKYSKKDTFFHYTNLLGLKAILENQSFFASNSAFLNDKEEFYFGIKLFCETIDNLESKKEFLACKGLFKNIKSLLNLKKSNRYVTCFSLNGDLLSQWRAYADDGKGIAIGFDPKRLSEAFEIKAEGLFIVYKDSQQKIISNAVLRECTKFYIEKKNLFNWGGNELFDMIVAEEITFFINRYVGQFKHRAFIEEDEYRFDLAIDRDVNQNRELHYRVGKNNLLVPYLLLKTNYQDEKEQRQKSEQGLEELEKVKKYKVKQLPISSIIIGPSMDFDLNKLSIEEFLKKHGYSNVSIEKSKVPYRI